MPLSTLFDIFKPRKRTTLPHEDMSLHTLDGDSPHPCVEALSEERLLILSEKGTHNGLYYGQKAMAMRVICSPHTTAGDEKTARLLKAIQLGKISDVCCILEKYSSQQLNQVLFSGQNLLHYLTMKKDLDALTVVLAKGVEPNLFSVDGLTPLHLAILENWTEGVEVLLIHGASINLAPKSTGHDFGFKLEAPILMALRIGDFPTIFTLLEKSPDLTVKDDQNNSVLHLAATSLCFPALDQLLETGGQILNEIFSQNNNGDTPLHALFKGKNLTDKEDEILECLRLLLVSGAEINTTNQHTQSPLYLSCRRGLPKVVEGLLSAGADPMIKTVDGKTVLHAACRAGSPETLSLLLKTGRTEEFVNVEDSKGMSPFHCSVSSYSLECCEILLENGDHLTQKDCKNETRSSLALRNMPNAKQLFERVFNKHIYREKEIEDKDFSVSLDFSVLLKNPNDDIDDSIISEIYDSEVESLLKHPLVESFIYLKWNRLKFFFYSYVVLYLTFLILHTFFIVKTYGMNTNWAEEPSTIMTVRLLLIILLVILIIPAAITLFANFSKFMKQFETYFKMIALCSAVFVVFSQESMSTNPELERNMAAISIFFTWVEFMMLLGRFPSFGIYIFMFTRVAKSIIKFLLAFSSMLIAFSLSLTILFNEVPVFGTFSVGLVKTLMMMLGEIDYGDLYEGIKNQGLITIIIGHIFLITFVFLVPILMANLLIGLAVNDLPDLKTHGRIRRLVKEAVYIISYERICFVMRNLCQLPSRPREAFLKGFRIPRVVDIYPNRCNKTYKKLIHIPKEALEEVIVITADDEERSRKIQNNSLRLEDLQLAFVQLCRDFQEDKKKTEKKLEDILNIISGNVDQIDSPTRRSKRPTTKKRMQ